MMRGVAAVALCAMLGSSVEGCTAIGFAAGAMADARAGKGGPELLKTVPAGRPVTLFLRDGRRLEGTFEGWSRDSVAAAAAPGGAPPPEESVRLETSGGEVAIRAREIEKVSFTVNHGKVRGLLIGLAVDVAVLALSVLALGGMVDSAFGE